MAHRLPADPLRSLAGRLLLAVGLPLAVLVIGGATLDYRSARLLTDDAHDRVLATLAVGLSARLEAESDGDLAQHLPAMVKALGRSQPEDQLHFVVIGPTRQVVAGEAALAALQLPEAAAAPRLFTAWFLDQPMRIVQHDYRGPDTRARILVAETLNGRRAEARRLLYVVVLTNTLTALAVVLAALFAVRFALQPLTRLGLRLEGHEAQALRPLPLRAAPTETLPLLRAINRLMSRVRAAAQARQDFINGTAHQLRTPLAGLSAQVELLQRQPMPSDLARRVGEVAGSVQRLSHLAHQMLALARADAESGSAVVMQPVSLPDLLQEVASARLDAALARHADLGFEPGPALVHGSPWLLRELLLNLVDNAIAHTPEGTAVTVRSGQTAEGPFLEVEDDGPGIAPQARQRVFERFVRLSEHDGRGSGLGLAIVQEIAARHAARVTLGAGPGERGTRVTVRFPAAAPLSAV